MLVTTTPVVNLGPLKYGVKHSFDYLVTNTSDKVVNIDRLISGCHSCTKASIDKNVLSPNETAIISVNFTPGSLGLQTKTISVIAHQDAKTLPSLDLKFKSIVHD